MRANISLAARNCVRAQTMLQPRSQGPNAGKTFVLRVERRKFRTAKRTSATRSGVVQSPSMYDSPIPISAPVNARRKNRSS